MNGIEAYNVNIGEIKNIEINIKVNKTIPSYATTIPKPQAILIVSISLTPRAMKSPTVFFSYDSFGSF